MFLLAGAEMEGYIDMVFLFAGVEIEGLNEDVTYTIPNHPKDR